MVTKLYGNKTVQASAVNIQSLYDYCEHTCQVAPKTVSHVHENLPTALPSMVVSVILMGSVIKPFFLIVMTADPLSSPTLYSAGAISIVTAAG